MTKQQAAEKGLVDTYFHYNASYEEKHNEVKRLRKAGYKASLVRIPPNPLSRGCHGPIFCVYASKRLQMEKDLAVYEKKINNFPEEIASLKARHAKEQEEMQARHAALTNHWMELGKELIAEKFNCSVSAVDKGMK